MHGEKQFEETKFKKINLLKIFNIYFTDMQNDRQREIFYLAKLRVFACFPQWYPSGRYDILLVTFFKK